MGFALIFYGLNLMTGGLRPLRNMPEVMSAISSAQGRQLHRPDLLRAHRGAHHGDDPLVVGDDRHRDGPRRRRRARLADGGRLLARRRPRHDDHVVDGLAQPVEERQARGLRAHLVQHHRRRRDAAAVLPVHAAAGLGHGILRRRSRRGGHASTARRPSRWCRWRSASTRPPSTSSTPRCCSRSSACSSGCCRAIGHTMRRGHRRLLAAALPRPRRSARTSRPACRACSRRWRAISKGADCSWRSRAKSRRRARRRQEH